MPPAINQKAKEDLSRHSRGLSIPVKDVQVICKLEGMHDRLGGEFNLLETRRWVLPDKEPVWY